MQRFNQIDSLIHLRDGNPQFCSKISPATYNLLIASSFHYHALVANHQSPHTLAHTCGDAKFGEWIKEHS